jgi:peptide/nickel transport system substrate-binding protein
MRWRPLKFRFRRQFKRSQRQVEDFSVQAEAGLEQHLYKRLGKLTQVWRFVTLWLLLIAFLGGCVVAETENLSNYYQTTQPVAGGNYSEGVLGTFTNANPLYATSEVNSTVSHLIFSGLFKYNSQNQLVDDLASSWSVDSKGTTYTVTLRPNLTWQDGQPLTADDVVFTYQAIQDPDAQSPLNSSWAGIKVTKVNNLTVSFTLPNPLSSFLYSLTNGIVPAHLLSNVPITDLRSADFNTVHPIGSGPFAWNVLQVSNSNPITAQIEIALKPFDHYYGGTPKLSSFEIHAFADKDQLLSAFQHQSVNAIAGVADIPRAVTDSKSVHQYSMLLDAENMVFFNNSTTSILSDAQVRHALVQSANIPAIVSHLGYTTNLVTEPLLQSQLGYDPTYAQPGFNLVTAGQTLTQDGWVAGPTGLREKAGKPLSISLFAPDTKEARQVTVMLAAQWKVVGVKTIVQTQDTQDFQSTLASAGASANYDALLYGISVGVDPDVFVYWDSTQTDPRSTRLNLSDYKNTTADASLEAGRTRLDPALRVIKYKPFLQAWQTDSPALGLYQPRFLYVTHETVYGLNSTAINSDTDRFSNVQNWEIRTTKVTN